ncbi:hypothetical protein FHX81_7733 [Saccharothrix saharensis]|uniref:Uncharacterized protein n=1 Tax=Saccharothrix saharensis TaxID=571190 RepID=A0A543JR58_9PSEU|nr:hypothetical protein [Saccharothrix saharensis]TQM85254.1 hypothetical protein FHX81_7733 [Saccharothrix saharensis]
MMAKFEDQLFDDLMRAHGSALDTVPDRPATSRRGVGRALGIGGTALGAAGVIALTGTFFTGGSSAYAVTKGADGVVEVSISDLTGVTGANEELRRLGVRAVAVPMRDGCVDLASLPVDTASRGTGITASTDARNGNRTGSMKFDADEIPEGDTLLLAAAESADSLTLGAALIKGAAPDCVSTPKRHAGELPNGERGQEVRPDEPTGSAVRRSGS